MRYTLHYAQLEAQPPLRQQGRFRLRVNLEPAPTPPANTGAGALRLTAMLTPKAATAQCPLPGSIFFDGFDLP